MLLPLIALLLVAASGRAAAGDAPDMRAEGKAIIHNFGCIACHEISGQETTVRQDAPNLTFEGEIVRPDWLFAFLKLPRSIRPAIKARMPDFRLTDKEALAITEYLTALTDSDSPVAEELRRPKTPQPEEIEAAKKLTSPDYFNCFNCHIRGSQKPAGEPTDWAPDLYRIPSRINPGFIYKWLQNPPKYRPGTKMPAIFPDQDSGPDDILGGDEVKQTTALRNYLFSIGTPENFPDYAEVKKKYPDIKAAEGRTLVLQLNCVGCHEFAVLPERKKIGPNLTYQGSRVQKEWLVAFLGAPRTIKPEYALMGSPARMPTFHFTERELAAVVEYITQELVDPQLPQVDIDPNLAGRGQELFREKRCNNCHRIGASPGGIGPELTQAGKRLRPAWTINFIQRPSHFLDTRMPNLQVSAEEAKALASYILGAKP